MKKQLLILIACIVAPAAFAQQQLPNASFENWSQQATSLPYEEPDSWFGTSVSCHMTGNGPTVCSATTVKTTDAYAGTYAATLVNIKTDERPVMKGQLIYSPGSEGFETFNSRPAGFSGYYKFNNAGADEILIAVTLTRADYTPVAYGKVLLEETKSVYTSFNFPIQYYSTDEIEIAYVLIEFNDSPNSSSSFTVDNLSFTYLPTPVRAKTPASAGLQFFPNPAKDEIHFDKPVSNISIATINGLNVLKNSSETGVLNISSLQKGLYIISYEHDHVLINGKLVVE